MECDRIGELDTKLYKLCNKFDDAKGKEKQEIFEEIKNIVNDLMDKVNSTIEEMEEIRRDALKVLVDYKSDMEKEKK